MNMHSNAAITYDVGNCFSVGGRYVKHVRLNHNTLKIFLTSDDLDDKGITVDDLKNNCLKVQSIVQSMVENACEEAGFQMKGAMEIEIYSMYTGLIMVVTRNEDCLSLFSEEESDSLELQVRLEERMHVVFEVEDLEDLIHLCKRLITLAEPLQSNLFFYREQYILQLEQTERPVTGAVISLAAEYGNLSTLTWPKVQEYGKEIAVKDAIGIIAEHFR